MAIIRKFKRSISNNNASPDNINNYSCSSDILKLVKEKNIKDVPLDLEELIKILGIKIEYKSLNDGVSGILKREFISEWIWTIYVNNEHPETRQRFTIAHEIAHWCLHGHTKTEFEDIAFFRATPTTSKEEYEANQFAGEILMPEERFREQIRQGNTKIADLADFFKVSALALRVRAKILGMKGHGL